MSTLNKQRAEQAVVQPPEYIRQVLQETQSREPIKPGTDRDKMMLEFAQSDVWVILKRYIESRLSELAQGLRKASDGNSSMEEVGFRFMVADRVNDFASGLIGFVETPLKIKKAQVDNDLSEDSNK